MTAYVTHTDIRLYLDKVASGAGVDTLLDTIGTRATAIVDRALGFSFAAYPGSASDSIAFGGGTPILYLPPHQQGSVTTITPEGGTAIDDTTWTEQADGSIYLDSAYAPWLQPYASMRYGPGWGFYRYTVAAKWGYGPVPEDVKEVALEIAVNIWRSKDKGLWTDVIGVEGGGGIRFIGGLTNQQKAIIDAVRAQYNTRILA
jgi:hypothetical protein